MSIFVRTKIIVNMNNSIIKKGLNSESTTALDTNTLMSRGRKKGTAKKLTRFEMRCSNEFIEALDRLSESNIYIGKSKSEIMHEIVINNLLFLEVTSQL